MKKTVGKKIVLWIAVFSFAMTTERALAATTNYKRVISLKPNITEIVFELGASNKLIGVTTWCDRPAKAKKIEKVADYIKPNLEKIIALKPDLVITSEENSIKRPIKLLEKAGIKVRLFSFKTIKEIKNSITGIGKLLDKNKEAKTITDEISTELKKSNHQQTKILIIVGKRPLVAAGNTTYLGELLVAAGGKNIVSSKMAYPHLNKEQIIIKNPDLILDMTMGSESRNKNFWKTFPINAVEMGQLYSINISDYRPGAGTAKQIKTLRKMISER